MPGIISRVGGSPEISKQGQPQGHSHTNRLARQGTASSLGSNHYRPMPTGRWLLECHVSCPRCHHYHCAAELKIDICGERSTVSPVVCERCKEQWAAFGGRNSTQLSLLSVVTVIPDRLEREVHRALVEMIRPATAVATSLLANNVEANISTVTRSATLPEPGTTALRSSSGGHPGPQGRPNLQSMSTTGRVTRGDRTGVRHYSLVNLRQRLAARLSTLHRSAATKSLVKPDLPCVLPASVDESSRASTMSDSAETRRRARTQIHRSHPPTLDVAAAPNLSLEAETFIAEIKGDLLGLIKQEDRVQWARKKFTDFRMRRVRATIEQESCVIDTTSLASLDALSQTSNSQLNHRQSTGLLVGSHHSHLDGLYAADLAPDAQRDSTSERTSEVTTAFGDDYTRTRAAWQGLRPHERRDSGSSRPLSVQSTTRSQQTHQGLAEARHSQDFASNAAAVRNTSTSRARNSHRWSGGSASRVSTEALRSPMFPSQILYEEQTRNDSNQGNASLTPEL